MNKTIYLLLLFFCMPLLMSAQTSTNFALKADVFDSGGLGRGLPASTSFAATSIVGQSAGLLKSGSSSFEVMSGIGCVFCGDFVQSVQPIPEERSFRLQQNYPNPFKPVTTIAFSLENPGSVEIGVYSLLGTRVATVTNGHFTSGAHSVMFDASDLPGGVYIYRLTTRHGSEIRRLIVLK